MNSSEVNNLVTVLVMFGAPWVAKYGISSQELSMVIGPGIAFAAACWAVFSHWNMKKVPEKATVIPPVASVIAVFFLGGFLFVWFNHPAYSAGLSRPATTRAAVAVAPKLPADPLKVIQAFTVSDLDAALADASMPVSPLPVACNAGMFKTQDGTPCVSDPTAAACYGALIPYVQANIKNPLPTQLGLFLAFQKARDLKTVINGGIPAAINDACAPLVLDAANTVIGLGAKVGLGIALPGGLPFGL